MEYLTDRPVTGDEFHSVHRVVDGADYSEPVVSVF